MYSVLTGRPPALSLAGCFYIVTTEWHFGLLCRAAADNPCPNQGDIINIRLSEAVDTVQTPEGIFRPMIVETYFQMNYATGESKRVTKMREIETEAE